MIAFLNAFLAAYLLDAALTVCDGFLQRAGVTRLALPREALALLVFCASPLLLGVTLLSSRLPKRILLPLALATVWLNLGALPLGPRLGGPLERDVALGLLQASLALPTLLWVRRRSGGTAWGFASRWLPEPRRDRPRRARLLVSLGIGVPAAIGLLAVGGAVVLTERATAGFVGFGSEGLTLAERHYRRGGQEVQLIGMSHVAPAGTYDSLLAPSDGRPTLILAEGVSDDEGLLGGASLQEPLALALGLESQPGVDAMLGPETAGAGGDVEGPDIETADLDVRTFRESSVEFLRLALRLNAAPGDAEARRELEALTRAHGSRELYFGVFDDILYRRNQHLLERIDAALERYDRVVVPWGVLHLPGIEAGLLVRGFRLTSDEPRSFLPYGALARMLERIFSHPAAVASPGA